MFGMPDAYEEKLEKFLDAGGVMNIREEQLHFEGSPPVIHVWCHATPAVKEQLGLRLGHWGSRATQFAAAMTGAMYWMR